MRWLGSGACIGAEGSHPPPVDLLDRGQTREVQPVLTPAEMAAVDAAAPEPVAVLVDRAAAAVARVAREMLGGTYGRRVVVLAGKGNNGNDGRVAAGRLERAGVHVTVIDAHAAPATLPHADLVIDAAFGTGFRGTYAAPNLPPGTPVLAVDIPSGVSGLTGAAHGVPLAADRTVTFAALKPGLLLADGRTLAGEVALVDLGLDVRAARAHVVEASDVARWFPRRDRGAHKWRAATWVVAGSPTMLGAAHLCARAAGRAGASYVRLSSPGVTDDPGRPTESVGEPLPADGWAEAVVAGQDRFHSLAVGPGLGTAAATLAQVRELAAQVTRPLVLDGDALRALGTTAADVLGARPAGSPLVVLTPHEGEFARLGGRLDPGDDGIDRFAAVRELAARVGAVVLLKGPVTLVAAPDGRLLVVTAGDERLATAGTGDVLTGTVAALLAGGAEPFEGAAAAAWLHGRAGALACRYGLVASDLPDRLPQAIEGLWPDH